MNRALPQGDAVGAEVVKNVEVLTSGGNEADAAPTVNSLPGIRPALRIALVTTFYPPLNLGGDGQYVRRFAHALAKRGCQVDVIHDADAWRVVGKVHTSQPLPPPLPEPPGVTVHRLETLWSSGSALLTHQLGRPVVHGRTIAKLLDKADVVHFHNVSLVGGAGVLALGDGLKFYTAHEHWLVCPNHVLWRYKRELCDSRDCFKCSIDHRRPPQLNRAAHIARSARNVDTFIALSQSVADNHKAFGFEIPMTLMASFLPDDEAKTKAKPGATRNAAPARPYFLFVGRLEMIKGLQDVIPLFDETLGADLVIAGAGDYEAELRALAADRPAVKFVGQIDPQDLAQLYDGARALIAPSLCYEVFPMVVLEAFREGAPIIARRLGPYPQIVEESAGGLLFGDAAELRAAILALKDDGALRDRLGQSGRRAIETRWSEDTAMTDYLELIRTTAMTRNRPQVADKVGDLREKLKATDAAAHDDVAAHREARPGISVIMPAYNAADYLRVSLPPLAEMLERGEIAELLVVDDCSTDAQTVEVAKALGAQVLSTPHNMGPGGARNLAARLAKGDILWLVDADVVAKPGSADLIRHALSEPGVAAVFGSYDDQPPARNFWSQYKNLVHRFYHQRSLREASTFWSGCGAVRRDIYLQLGGFDVARFKRPSVEDIELGYRMRDAGYRIALETRLQATHLKRWTLGNVVHTDIFCRALPWSRMLAERGKVDNELNVSNSERARAALAGLVALSLIVPFVAPSLWFIPFLMAAAAIAANAGLFVFMARIHGLLFALASLAFHQVYYLYSAAIFVFCAIEHRLGATATSRQRRQGLGA